MTLPAVVQPLSAEERAEIVKKHSRATSSQWRAYGLYWCAICIDPWPCVTARWEATCAALENRAKRAEAERDAAFAALREIREQTLGAVCDDYELCAHRSCRASYAAWAVASAALERLERLAKEGSGE